MSADVSALSTDTQGKRDYLDVSYTASSPTTDAAQMGIQDWVWTVDEVGSFTFSNFHENTDPSTGSFLNYIWYSTPGDFAVITEDKSTFRLIDTTVQLSDPSGTIASFQLADFDSSWEYSGIVYDDGTQHTTVLKIGLMKTQLATMAYVNQLIGEAIETRV